MQASPAQVFPKKGVAKTYMRATYSYESILRAVGRVLDQSGVEGIAVRETDTGIVVEGAYQDGKTQVRMTYDLADLCDLIDQNEGRVEDLFATASTPAPAHRLHEFLTRHQVVAAR